MWDMSMDRRSPVQGMERVRMAQPQKGISGQPDFSEKNYPEK
jgi:hypothetical protein